VKWFDLAVCPKTPWPNVLVEVPFEGYKIVLQPRRQDSNGIELAATVSVYDPNGLTFEVGGTVASRFLSRLAWSQNEGIVELCPAGSNNSMAPGRLCQGTYERSGCAQVDPWDFIYLPSARSNEADLALGLFREGMSINSTPFAFLSYFKVLNILHGRGPSQKQWIKDNLRYLRHQSALVRLAELRETETDTAKYLYEEGRCAVAHAHDDPLVNPDSYADKRRMEGDLNLMKAIAATFIERELGVPSNSSFWQGLKEGKSCGSDLLRKTMNDHGQVKYVPEQAPT